MPATSSSTLYFIHVPKTAGTYVTAFLHSELGATFVREGHTVAPGTLRPWMERFGPCHYAEVARADCFTFSVVRNPFDLLVSMYMFGFPYWSPKYYAGTGCISWPFRSFRDYVTKLCAWDDYPWICPEQKKSLFFQLHDQDGRCFADLVLRQERIREGLKALGQVLGHDWDPPQEKVNTGSGHSYMDFYDHDLAELVASRFARDLALFGYDFASHDERVAIKGADCRLDSSNTAFARTGMKLPELSGRLADQDFHALSDLPDQVLQLFTAKRIGRHLLGRVKARFL